MGLLGVAVMHLGDRLSPMENADDFARDVLNVLIAGLQSGTVLRSSGPPMHCPEAEVKTPIEAKRSNHGFDQSSGLSCETMLELLAGFFFFQLIELLALVCPSIGLAQGRSI